MYQLWINEFNWQRFPTFLACIKWPPEPGFWSQRMKRWKRHSQIAARGPSTRHKYPKNAVIQGSRGNKKKWKYKNGKNDVWNEFRESRIPKSRHTFWVSSRKYRHTHIDLIDTAAASSQQTTRCHRFFLMWDSNIFCHGNLSSLRI